MTKDDQPTQEPAFKAPWPSVVLPIALVIAYILQETLLSRAAVLWYALSTWFLVGEGRWEVLFTHMFLHEGSAHVLMNAGSALAFGPPVARLSGHGVRGAILFFLFFLACGVLAGLGYIALHMSGSAPVIGASGAVSGLWGAASRLLGRKSGVAPILSRQVLSQAAVFTVMNVVIGIAGGFTQLNIAWEAHLGGYLAGLILIGPTSLMGSRSRARELPTV